MAEKDDLEAVRTVVAGLEGFSPDEQERILRWAREKLNLPVAASLPVGSGAAGQQHGSLPAGTATQQPVPKDLRTFVAEKQPKNDVQFAATVAYFLRFEAPEGQRKSQIAADDLTEACRLVVRQRLRNPRQTLANAHTLGLLDRPSRGVFSLNSVGENLVAMTLPSDGKSTPSKGKPNKTFKKATKPTSKKRSAK